MSGNALLRYAPLSEWLDFTNKKKGVYPTQRHFVCVCVCAKGKREEKKKKPKEEENYASQPPVA